MSVTTVFVTCPHCDLEYWLVIDMAVVEQLEKGVTCGSCKRPFDLRERLSNRGCVPGAPPPFEVEDEPDTFAGRAKFSRVDERMRYSWFAATVPGIEPEPEPPESEPPPSSEPPVDSEPPVVTIESEPSVSIVPYFSEPPLEIDVGDLSEFEPVLVLEPPRLPREVTGDLPLPEALREPPEEPEAQVPLELDLASMAPKPISEGPRRKLVVPRPPSKR